MLVLQFNNLSNLNVSLQVGDAVYARDTTMQTGAKDLQAGIPIVDPTGSNHYVGILMKIDDNGSNQYDLHIDTTVDGGGYQPGQDDFIMISKFSQGDSGVLGYYAEAKFTNDSKVKAELFAVSSEIIINSN